MALAGIWNLGTPKVSVLYDFTIFFTYMNSDLSLYNLKCSIWIYHHKIINEFKKYEFMKNIVKLQTWNYVPSWQWSASSPAGLSPTVALRPLAGTGLSGTVCFSFAGAAVPNRAAGPNLIFCFLKSRSCRRHQRTGLCKLLCKRCAAWFCLNFMDFTWTDFTWIKPEFAWISPHVHDYLTNCILTDDEPSCNAPSNDELLLYLRMMYPLVIYLPLINTLSP